MGERKLQPQQSINAEPEMMEQIQSIAAFLESTLGAKYQISFQQLDNRKNSGEIVAYPHNTLNTLWIQDAAGTPKALLQIRKKPAKQDHYTPAKNSASLPNTKFTEEVAAQTTQELVQKKGIPADRLNMEEKIEIVRDLSQKGIFQLKGSVSSVAQQLHCSEPSVYRYITLANQAIRQNA